MKKRYTFWVVKIRHPSGASYFTGDTYGVCPYSDLQKEAGKFLTKELAEAAIGPRIATGVVHPRSLSVHRLYRHEAE